jgi:hypothetical protein
METNALRVARVPETSSFPKLRVVAPALVAYL